MLTWKNYEETLQTHGLAEYTETLRPYLTETLHLQLQPPSTTPLAIGATHIGGLPDLPTNIPWPEKICQKKLTLKERINSIVPNGPISQPMAFVGQINLHELPLNHLTQALPRTGMLYFFYDLEQEGWGFDPADKDSFRVIYYNGETETLQSGKTLLVPPEIKEYGIFECSPLIFEIGLSVNPVALYNEIMGEDKEELFRELIYKEAEFKMFGYPDPIQTPYMDLECELIRRGYYLGDKWPDICETEELAQAAKEWQLLLQVDSVGDMMWGDSGKLYFWILEADLKAAQFENSWCILQCY